MLDCIESLFKIQLSIFQQKEIARFDEEGHSDRILFCEQLKSLLKLPEKSEFIWQLIKTNVGFFVSIEKEARAVLKTLQEKYDLVILTNGGIDNQQRKIRETGLTDFFSKDKIFISEAIGFDKPHPEAFQFVENKFASDSRFCMIGDHWGNDILGALKFGWRSIYLSPNSKKNTHENVIKITTLSDLINLKNGGKLFD